MKQLLFIITLLLSLSLNAQKVRTNVLDFQSYEDYNQFIKNYFKENNGKQIGNGICQDIVTDIENQTGFSYSKSKIDQNGQKTMIPRRGDFIATATIRTLESGEEERTGHIAVVDTIIDGYIYVYDQNNNGRKYMARTNSHIKVEDEYSLVRPIIKSFKNNPTYKRYVELGYKKLGDELFYGIGYEYIDTNVTSTEFTIQCNITIWKECLENNYNFHTIFFKSNSSETFDKWKASGEHIRELIKAETLDAMAMDGKMTTFKTTSKKGSKKYILQPTVLAIDEHSSSVAFYEIISIID
jgi:hypothetical protein